MIHGRHLRIYQNGTAVAGCKSCSVQHQCDTIETSSPASGVSKSYIAGRKSWKVSCSWLLSSTSVASSRLLMVGNSYLLTFRDQSGTLLQGYAIMTDCSVEATTGNLATGSFSFLGTGDLATA